MGAGEILPNAVTSGKILSGSVGTAKLADLAVNASKLATDAVTSAKIQAAAVTQAKIAPGAVTGGKIADGAIGAGKLQPGIPIDMQDALLDSPEIRDYAETSPTLAISAGTLTIDLESGNVFEVTLTQDVTSLTLVHPPSTGRAGSCSLDPQARRDRRPNFYLAGRGKMGRWGAACHHERCQCGRRVCVDHEGWRCHLVRFSRRTGLQLMLGVLRAALPGAAFAQSSGTLVSLWAFDETSGAGGVFDDLGPADLPMSIVGSWPDLTTGSIVQGVGGTSAYTDGSAYATIPADQAAHALNALTLSFYYERGSAAAKQILLAAGDGSQAGDFSIEVLANGRLRGYHVGQDGVLRFFEDGAGITGTNLQVGTAHRIDLSLGPQGARIYLDGAELTAAAIPANVNGWNNARVKYLGVLPDGASGPAVGAFDRFRLWNRQLANAEIALLEPAQSTALPSRLASWRRARPCRPWRSGCAATRPIRRSRSTCRARTGATAPGRARATRRRCRRRSMVHRPAMSCSPCARRRARSSSGTIRAGSASRAGPPATTITLQARKGDGVVISAGEDFAGARTPAAASGRRAG